MIAANRRVLVVLVVTPPMLQHLPPAAGCSLALCGGIVPRAQSLNGPMPDADL